MLQCVMLMLHPRQVNCEKEIRFCSVKVFASSLKKNLYFTSLNSGEKQHQVTPQSTQYERGQLHCNQLSTLWILPVPAYLQRWTRQKIIIINHQNQYSRTRPANGSHTLICQSTPLLTTCCFYFQQDMD